MWIWIDYCSNMTCCLSAVGNWSWIGSSVQFLRNPFGLHSKLMRHVVMFIYLLFWPELDLWIQFCAQRVHAATFVWLWERITCFLCHLCRSHSSCECACHTACTPPTQSYQWQLVFCAFTCSALSDTKHSWDSGWHIVPLVLSPTNSRLWGFFPLCSQSQDAPPTVIWAWVMCC